MERSRGAIVLGGGDGVRLRPYVEQRFGEARPQQYSVFYGRRSFLRHTLDRAEALVRPDRTVAVIAADHEPWASRLLAGHRGLLISQAVNRGAVWNTMVIAATVDAVWSAGAACIPAVTGLFEGVLASDRGVAERIEASLGREARSAR